VSDLFKVQSYNPRSHVVINTYTTAITYRSDELWNCIMVSDLLNQVEFCNKRIALLGSLAMPQTTWQFVTEYYRVTRTQALNTAQVIGGGIPIHYCAVCQLHGRKVQATYKQDDGITNTYVCDLHRDPEANNIERIW